MVASYSESFCSASVMLGCDVGVSAVLKRRILLARYFGIIMKLTVPKEMNQ